MKKKYITIVLICFTALCYAQVGVNTISPDPSSMLDISSDVSGLLIPRMTTVEREAITSPAQSLLVYDIDKENFYYYQDEWTPINQQRDNYKLVKSIDDLAEELAAGGGSEYVLTTDFLYEINGNITFDFPVDLNGAYVEGVDTGSDILTNASGSALFSGSEAGSLRNMRILGNGQPIFNINGSGAETLLVNNTIFIGASELGTLSNLNVVFFSAVQFVSNTDGFTINNITSFFASNSFWTVSNQGTYLTVSGTFDNFQAANGRIVADSGETGIDVSANPTITNDATLSQLSFVGDGTYVNSYTVGTYPGFNFTTDWNVNCSGIPIENDEVASANFYYDAVLGTGFTQTINNNTPVQVQNATDFIASNLFRFASANNNNEVVYEGKRTRGVQVNVSLSVRVAGAVDNFYAFAIARNGAVVTETNNLVQITSDTQIQNVALNGVLTLDPGDTVEVFTTRVTGMGSDTLVIFSENLSVR